MRLQYTGALTLEQQESFNSALQVRICHSDVLCVCVCVRACTRTFVCGCVIFREGVFSTLSYSGVVCVCVCVYPLLRSRSHSTMLSNFRAPPVSVSEECLDRNPDRFFRFGGQKSETSRPVGQNFVSGHCRDTREALSVEPSFISRSRWDNSRSTLESQSQNHSQIPRIMQAEDSYIQCFCL